MDLALKLLSSTLEVTSGYGVGEFVYRRYLEREQPPMEVEVSNKVF